MSDIVERLRFDSARCETQFSKGVAGNIKEAAAEIVRLRDMIDNRNEFIAEHGLWRELGKYLSEPHADEQTTGGKDG